MKHSYRIAELENIVDAFRHRAFEAERESDEYKHRCKVSDGACGIAEQQRDHWMQRAKAAERERDEMKGSLKAAFVNAETWMKRALKAETEIARRDAAAGELPSAELSRLRKWVKCVEAERDKAISWHSSLLKKHDKLQADIARRDAVSFEMKVHYSGIGKSGPWVKLNDQRAYEKLKLRHSGDADYEFRELYTAAPPVVLPIPSMSVVQGGKAVMVPTPDGHWLNKTAVLESLDAANVPWS